VGSNCTTIYRPSGEQRVMEPTSNGLRVPLHQMTARGEREPAPDVTGIDGNDGQIATQGLFHNVRRAFPIGGEQQTVSRSVIVRQLIMRHAADDPEMPGYTTVRQHSNACLR
jgi:hypothetical protein